MDSPLPISAIPLPTPWPPVGPVMAYVVRQDPITVIDAGLNTPASRDALTDGLKQMGLTLKDIRRVLITHAHLDHYGAAPWIQSESGADLYLHPDEYPKIALPDWWVARRTDALNDAGVPASTQAQMEHHFQKGRTLTMPLTDWHPLADGQRLPFADGYLEAVHVPGHALGHTAFWEPTAGILFGGDHLLDGITPNPIMEPLPPGSDSGALHAPSRALTLGQFITSLERVIAMPVRQVYPGHGPVILDHVALAHSYIARHRRRLDFLWNRIQGGATAYAVTKLLYPRVREFDIFLSLSEVLAHLDLLVAEGRAVSEPGETGCVFRPI